MGNAVIYAARGKWSEAGISLLGIIPYVGDLAKAGKLAKGVFRAAEKEIVQTATKSSEIIAESKAVSSAGKGVSLGDDFIESATKPWGDQGLTEAGRALQKHSGREGSVFQGVKFSHKTANKDALDIINTIKNSPNQIIQPAENGGTLIFDKISRMGVGVSRNGLFNGFRELPK